MFRADFIETKKTIMKNLLLLTFSVLTIPVFGQTDTAAKAKKLVPHLAIIRTMDGSKTKGWLYKMDDNNIYLLPANRKKLSLSEFKSPDLNKSAMNFNISQINTISTQKKSAGLKGALIGLGAGTLIGVISGFASGDDPVTPYTGTFADPFIAIGNAFAMTAEEKAVANGIGLGLTGAITGFVIGKLAKKKFIIGGKKESYRDLQGELMKRLILK
jgi:hypothetical protein